MGVSWIHLNIPCGSSVGAASHPARGRGGRARVRARPAENFDYGSAERVEGHFAILRHPISSTERFLRREITMSRFSCFIVLLLCACAAAAPTISAEEELCDDQGLAGEHS